LAKTTAEKILLGHGVVSVGDTPIGLTRGGSVFLVEREYREIEADGDRGPVKGRIVIDREVAKLTVNALELFSADEMTKYYPAMNLATNKLTSTLKIVEGDYNDVTWTGKTKDGKALIIKIEDAINMGNIEWTLEDKNEVVPALEFTAAYDEATRDTPPWNVEFIDGDNYQITILVKENSMPVQGAEVIFFSRSIETGIDGKAVFANVPEGNNRKFSVNKGGFQTYFGAVDVDQAKTVEVILTEI